MNLNASELRLGNLFIEENSGKIISVIGLEKNRIVFDGMFLDKWQAKPIKITEEWLKRMPFNYADMEDTNEDNTWYWLKYGNYLKFNSDKSCGFEAIFITINGFAFKIEYLHDFQNLYYTLTGNDVVIPEQ